MTTWRAIWRDERGELAGRVESDGVSLTMDLAGVRFVGRDLDGFEPAVGTDPASLQRFVLAGGELCAGTLVVEIPVRVRDASGGESEALLEAAVKLGRPRPAPRGGIDEESVRLALSVDGRRLESRGASGWFEDELADLQRALPGGARLATCFGCAFSDYSPAGHGLFGSLHCFRHDKAGYRAVTTKADLFRLMEKARAPCVQETWRCPEFEPRPPGTGYRG